MVNNAFRAGQADAAGGVLENKEWRLTFVRALLQLRTWW